MTSPSIPDLLPHLTTLLSVVPIGLAAFDLDLRCLCVNRAFAMIGGRLVDSYARLHAEEVLPWATDATIRILRAVADAGESCTGQRIRISPTGQASDYHDYDVGYYPARDGAGMIVGVTVLVSEIADRRELSPSP